MFDKKKIILVANSTWNIYNFRLNLIKRLSAEGHDLFVIAPIDEYLEYKDAFPKVKHIPLKTLSRDSTNPLKDLLLTLELYRKYAWIKPDLAIHYTNKPNIFGGFAAKLTKVNSVAVITGLGYTFIHKGLLNSLVRFLYKLTKTCHRKYIFENQDDMDLFLKEGISNSQNSHSVKGCGVDTEYYIPCNTKKETDKLVFTFVGRLLHDKGIMEFIQAAKIVKSKIPQTRFLVVGEFDTNNPSTIDRDFLADWVDSGIIEYKGFVKDIRPILCLTNCVVLPSYREGMPRTLLEGMSMGIPLITTDVPGCRETVEDKFNGFIVPAKDPIQLANSMFALMNMSVEERNKMGSNGREMAVSYFDSKLIAANVSSIINPILDE